jgi:hypothetical protein
MTTKNISSRPITMHFRLTALAALLGAVGCGGGVEVSGEVSGEVPNESLPPAPANWTTIETGCGFTLRAPADLEEVEVQPVDSCVFELSSTTCSVTADYGGFSANLEGTTGLPEYTATLVTIDGRDATVVTVMLMSDDPQLYGAAAHFPEVDPAKPGLKLTVWAACDTRPERDALKAILGTIRFL